MGPLSRLQKTRTFISLGEQCFNGGRVMEAVHEGFKVNMKDNRLSTETMTKCCRSGRSHSEGFDLDHSCILPMPRVPNLMEMFLNSTKACVFLIIFGEWTLTNGSFFAIFTIVRALSCATNSARPKETLAQQFAHGVWRVHDGAVFHPDEFSGSAAAVLHRLRSACRNEWSIRTQRMNSEEDPCSR